jgi:AhpD family alkylhydroperoxidase
MITEKLLKFPQLSAETADADSAELLNSAKKTVGFVPNMFSVMANFPAILSVYNDGYKKFRETSGFTPIEQEVVFLTVSHVNDCHYCVAAHSMVADKMSGVPADMLESLRAGKPLVDPKLQTLAALSRELVEQRGQPSEQTVKNFLESGYNETHLLAIVLAISTKVLSNYTNYLAETEVDPAFDTYKVA